MPRKKSVISPGKGLSIPPDAPQKTFHILVVDDDPRTCELISQALADQAVSVVCADSVQDATRCAAENPPDLMLVGDELEDGGGIAWAREQHQQRRTAQMIVLSDRPTARRALAALRIGAIDLLLKPLKADELTDRVRLAMHRQESRQRIRRRIHRLQRVCRKLQRAHGEVTQQVDILCSDLVAAYQELAQQMQQVVQTRDYVSLVRHELDLEQLLRKTLEYVLEKVGPTNAAIFLPASIEEFSLGGYVNYDWASESPELLLQLLADGIAAKVAAADRTIHLTEQAQLDEWLGDECDYLDGCHLVAVPCRLEGECLAVLMVFRDAAQPFSSTVVELCQALAPMLAEYLAKIIRIHHRHMPDPPASEEDGELSI
ncbi:MAG: response regulator [Phycisphaeraceae bacterium]|nr:response regulator [Phycisphaeraceae bacterium]